MRDWATVVITLDRKPGWWFRLNFWMGHTPSQWVKMEDSWGSYRVEY